MLEVPALVWQLPALLARADFLSVGSNDLHQFLFASDRGNARLSHRYDTLSPAMLSFLADLARRAEEAGKSITVCGEMAGRPLDALALLGIGYRSLSMAPPAVGPIKTLVRSVEAGSLARFVGGLLGSPERSLRERLRAYARDHEIAI
jgi:phosphotransferase system enzyme I (PtsP)